MSIDFRTVYEERARGQVVRLEASEQVAASGAPYLHHRLVVADGRVGAVIIAVSGERLLLVRSTRTAAGSSLWELPRGAGEADESLLDTALRELREETGLSARSPRELGRYVTDSSIFPQPVGVVICEVQENLPRSAPDGEIDGQLWVRIDSIAELVRDGTLSDAHTLAAITIYSVTEESR